MARPARTRVDPLPAPSFLERAGGLELPAVVVLAGAEAWFRERCLEALAARLLPEGDPGGAITRLDARRPEDRLRLPGILDELRTPSLFAPRRLVAVEHLGAGSEPADEGEEAEEGDGGATGARPRGPGPLVELANAALDAAVEGSLLVLATHRPVKGKGALPAALGASGALLVDCRPLYDAPAPWERGLAPHEHELARFLVRRAKACHGLVLPPEAAHEVSALVGSDLGALEGALRGLALHAGGPRTVGREDLDAVLGLTRKDAVWPLVDAVLDRDLGRALDLCEGAFERGLADGRGGTARTPDAVTGLLVGALHAAWRRTLAGAEALARGEPPDAVARGQGAPGFLAERFLARARRDPADLLRRHRAFVDAEAGFKSGAVPARLAAERLVIALAGGA